MGETARTIMQSGFLQENVRSEKNSDKMVVTKIVMKAGAKIPTRSTDRSQSATSEAK